MELNESVVELKLNPGSVYRENRLIPVASGSTELKKMAYSNIKRYTLRAEDYVCVLVLPDGSEGVFLDKLGTEYILSKADISSILKYRNAKFQLKNVPRFNIRRGSSETFSNLIKEFMLRSDLKRRFKGWKTMGGSIIGEDIVMESYTWLQVGSQYVSKDGTFKFEVLKKTRLGWLIKDLSDGKEYDVEESDLALFNPKELQIKESIEDRDVNLVEGKLIELAGKKVVVEALDEEYVYLVDDNDVRYRLLLEEAKKSLKEYKKLDRYFNKFERYGVVVYIVDGHFEAYQNGEFLVSEDTQEAMEKELKALIKKGELSEAYTWDGKSYKTNAKEVVALVQPILAKGYIIEFLSSHKDNTNTSIEYDYVIKKDGIEVARVLLDDFQSDTDVTFILYLTEVKKPLFEVNDMYFEDVMKEVVRQKRKINKILQSLE